MVMVDGLDVVDVKRATGESKALEKLESKEVSEVLFHHRMPTSTPNFIESTHPIKVEHPDFDSTYYVVHNGNIRNASDLKDEHEKQGFDYTTQLRKEWITRDQTYYETNFNDTESLAIDFALAMENDRDELNAKGSIAMIALQVDKETGEVQKLHYGRNSSNPLKLEVQDGQFMAIKSQGSGTKVTPEKLHTIDNNPDVDDYTERDFSFSTIGAGNVGYRKNYNYGNRNRTRNRNKGSNDSDNDNSDNNDVDVTEDMFDDIDPEDSDLDFGDDDLDALNDVIDNIDGKDTSFESKFGLDVHAHSYIDGFIQACKLENGSDPDQWLEQTANEFEAELRQLEAKKDELENDEDSDRVDVAMLEQRIELYWEALNTYDSCLHL
jgi:hypothetical protein